MFGYVKLPYEQRRMMRQARFFHRAAGRMLQGVHRQTGLGGDLTTSQQDSLFATARRLRDDAEDLERRALRHV